MAQPNHIFADQDCLELVNDDDDNLKAIQAFHPTDDKLALFLQETFNYQNLLRVFESLSNNFDRWKLTKVW